MLAGETPPPTVDKGGQVCRVTPPESAHGHGAAGTAATLAPGEQGAGGELIRAARGFLCLAMKTDTGAGGLGLRSAVPRRVESPVHH